MTKVSRKLHTILSLSVQRNESRLMLELRAICIDLRRISRHDTITAQEEYKVLNVRKLTVEEVAAISLVASNATRDKDMAEYREFAKSVTLGEDHAIPITDETSESLGVMKRRIADSLRELNPPLDVQYFRQQNLADGTVVLPFRIITFDKVAHDAAENKRKERAAQIALDKANGIVTPPGKRGRPRKTPATA